MTPRPLQLAIVSLSLAACSMTPGGPAGAPEADPLAWLAGCWVTADGSSEERWSAADGGYLFGYNVARANGNVVFFEQMRIEPGDASPVLHVYPRGIGPTSFTTAESGERSVAFVNPDNDFPQRIRYAREGDTLAATITLMDGSRPVEWAFLPCE